MEDSKQPLKSSVWFAVCNIVQKSAMLISVPIFTRMMSPEEYGLTAVYQSWNNVLIIVVTMSLSLGVFNNGMLRYKTDRERYISSMQGLSTITAIFFLLLFLLLKRPVTKIIGLSEPIILFMLVSYIFQPSFEYWSARNRYEYKYKGLLLATFIYASLNIIVPVMAVAYEKEKLGEIKILSTITVQIIFTFVFYLYNFYKGKNFYVKEYWKYAFCFNLPLIPNYLSNIVLGQSDRIMIDRYCGEAQAGIYSVACYLQTGVTVIISAVNSTFVPWLYERLEKKEYKQIQKRAELLLILLGFISFGIISCAPEIVKIMAPERYYDAVWSVPPVVIGTYFTVLYMFFANVEVYFEKRIFMSCATLMAAIANVVLNYCCIPIFGYMVCAYTTVFCYLIYALAHYIFMNQIKIDGEKLGKIRIYSMKRSSMIYMVVIVLSIVQTLLYKTLLLRYGIVLGITLIFFMVGRSKFYGK